MNFIEAQARAESLSPQFAILAARMTEMYSDQLHGERLAGMADVYSPPEGGKQDYEAVGLLGFDGNMALVDQALLLASDEALEEIANAIYLTRRKLH